MRNISPGNKEGAGRVLGALVTNSSGFYQHKLDKVNILCYNELQLANSDGTSRTNFY